MDAAALLAMKEFAGDDGDINLDSLIFEDGADEALASMLASPSGLPLEFDFEGGDTSSTDLEDDELGSIGSSDTNTSTSSKPSSPSMTDETISVASDDDDDARSEPQQQLLPPQFPKPPRLPLQQTLAVPTTTTTTTMTQQQQQQHQQQHHQMQQHQHQHQHQMQQHQMQQHQQPKFLVPTLQPAGTILDDTTAIYEEEHQLYGAKKRMRPTSYCSSEPSAAEPAWLNPARTADPAAAAAAIAAIAASEAATAAAVAERERVAKEGVRPKQLTSEEAVEDRKRKNREAAERSRLKRKALLATLPLENHALQERLTRMEAGLAAAQAEAKDLREQNAFLKSLLSGTQAMSSSVASAAGALLRGSRGSVDAILPTTTTTTTTTRRPATHQAAAAAAAAVPLRSETTSAKAAFFGLSVPSLNGGGGSRSGSNNGMMVLGVACVVSLHHIRLLLVAVGAIDSSTEVASTNASGVDETVSNNLIPAGSLATTTTIIGRGHGRGVPRGGRVLPSSLDGPSFQFQSDLLGDGAAAFVGQDDYHDDGWLVALWPVGRMLLIAAAVAVGLRLFLGVAPRVWRSRLGGKASSKTSLLPSQDERTKAPPRGDPSTAADLAAAAAVGLGGGRHCHRRTATATAAAAAAAAACSSL